MNDTINDLMKEFIAVNYPIKRIRINDGKLHKIKTNGNFKRVVKSPNKTYIISNNEQKHMTMRSIAITLSRIFNVSQKETLPLLKKHLRISKPLNKIQPKD